MEELDWLFQMEKERVGGMSAAGTPFAQVRNKPGDSDWSHNVQRSYQGIAAWLPNAGDGGPILGTDRKRPPYRVIDRDIAWMLFFTDRRVISIMEHRGADWRRPIDELRKLVYEREKSIREECEARAKSMLEVPL